MGEHWKIRLWRYIVWAIPSLRLRSAFLTYFLYVKKAFPMLGGFIPYSNVHGGFDALSPMINTESDSADIAELFRKAGFEDIKEISPEWCKGGRIHMQGRRKKKDD